MMANAAREGIARSETEITRGRHAGPLMMCPLASAAVLAVPTVPHLGWQVFWQLPLKIHA